MKNTTILHEQFLSRIAALCIIPLVLIGCSTATERRGFLEPSDFAGMLEANKKTLGAPDRSGSTVQTIALHPGSLEIRRNSSATFNLSVTEQPLLVRLSADVWHKGTDENPAIVVNGKAAGEMVLAWPSLRERNYVAFLWDDGPDVGYDFDYQGWLNGVVFIDGALLIVGENTISMSVKTDQIKVQNVTAELLCAFDDSDTIHDFRRKSKEKAIPMRN